MTASGMKPRLRRQIDLPDAFTVYGNCTAEKINADRYGMEKSVTANFADNVSVEVRNNNLEISVIKSC